MQVLSGIAHLHERCLQRSSLARDPDLADPSAQLAAVADFLGDLAVAAGGPRQEDAAAQPVVSQG